MWSSYLDPAYDRELRRRYRALKHKYANNIRRKLSWHEHPLAEIPRLALKQAVARYWAPTTSTCSSMWVNQDELDNRRRASSRPPNRVFVFDDLLLKRAAPWGSQCDQVFDLLSRKKPRHAKFQNHMEMKSERSHVDGDAKKSESQKAIRSKTNLIEGQDYVIDPITNRKVSRREHGLAEMDLNPPPRTFESHGSHFAPFGLPNLEQEKQPVYSNGKPSDSELSKYAQNKFDDWPATSTADSTESPADPETTSYVFDNSILKNEEYALNHLPPDDPIDGHDDLHNYRTATPDEPLEESSKRSKHHVAERFGPQSSTRSDPSPLPGLNPDQLESELRNYGPYMHNENSPAHTDSEDVKDLEKYQYNASDELEPSTEPPTVYNDLHKYIPTTSEDINDQDQPFEQYGGLEKYKAFRLQHLDKTAALERDIVAESLKEYETKERDTIVPDPNTHASDMPKKIPKMKLPERYIFSKDSPTQAGAETLSQNTAILNGKVDEINLEYLQSSWDSQGIEIIPTRLPAVSKKPHGQEAHEIIQNTEKTYSEGPSSVAEKAILQRDRDPPYNASRLEPALNRHVSSMKSNRLNSGFGADLYSKEPQGLETSFSEECGGRHTMPLYSRTYGSEPGQVTSRSKPTTENGAQESPERSSDLYYHRDPEIDGIPPSESTDQVRDRKATQLDTPTVYKILAYDPTMQTISVAETTSVVPDLASPLRPTEALLRLSNPTKFFPHFAPLQAEGFEIVAGGGDRLVFRQVRPAKVAAQGGTAYVNPIDMMGRSAAVPNAAAFVSPTGFVNYDIPRVEEQSAEPPFRSNIDVRREEPVFSGQKSSSRGKGGKKSEKARVNVGKRVIIGGAWVAGISYALGVVTEYFHTGGTDGKGPTGFSPI